jgi:hypothetical protein
VNTDRTGVVSALGRIGTSAAVAAAALVPVAAARLGVTWYVATAVVFGGLTYLILLLVEVQRRLAALTAEVAASAETTARTIAQGLAKVNEATELYGLIESRGLRQDVTTHLVQRATELERTAPLLVSRFAQSEIARMSEFLGAMGEGGEVVYEGEDRDWLLGLTRKVTASIDAVSLDMIDASGGGGGGLWASDLGQRYLDDQREAMKRGVRVRRIFVLDGPGWRDDPSLAAQVRQQQTIGIQVRVLDSSAVAASRRGSLIDFILFDDVMSYEVNSTQPFVDGAPSPILTTRLVLGEVRVADRIERFRDLWESATRLEPGPAGPAGPASPAGPAGG